MSGEGGAQGGERGAKWSGGTVAGGEGGEGERLEQGMAGRTPFAVLADSATFCSTCNITTGGAPACVAGAQFNPHS